MSCVAPTFENVFLEASPLEELRQTIGKLALDPSQQEFAYSLLDKLQEIQKTFEILSKTDKELFEGELNENISNVVKKVKSKFTEANADDEVISFAILPLIAILILISIFVLFGYKLYKSLIEKQKKRQDKVKTKHSKKKK